MMTPALRKRIARALIYTFSFLALAISGYIGYTAFHYQQMTKDWYQPLTEDVPSEIRSVDQPLPADRAQLLQKRELFEKAKPLKPFSLLLIGIDSRDGERARSDTMILASIHPAKQRAYLLSIPRDSFMKLPGRGYDKVNHAMAYGGPKLLKQSLEHFLGITIDRYMTIDFDGFRKIVDELGGVEVNVKKRMKYTDPSDDTHIDLQPGKQVLNGEQALDYARYRKSDLGREDSDYERIVRQQEILRALANKGDSVHAFLKAFKLMDILGQHVKTDLSEAEISSLLVTYYDPDKNHLETDTLRGSDQRIWRNGILGWYYLVPNEERNRVHSLLLQELKP
jgi:LCP family protein required for cell wall assembly